MPTNFDDDDVEVGNNANNNLTGNNNPNYLQGNGGDDTLSGGNGADQMDGGSGNDQLIGGNQNDEMYGGTGDDNLQGGSGNDYLHGGAGLTATVTNTGGVEPLTGIDYTINSSKVTLKPGDADYRVASGNNQSIKTIKFKSWDNGREDDATLDLSTFADDFNLKFTKGDSNDEVVLYGENINVNYSKQGVTDKGTVTYTGSDGNSYEIKFTLKDGVSLRVVDAQPNQSYSVTDKADTDSNGADTLDGGAGNDTLIGGNGNDSLLGGNDNDLLDGGSGNDTMFGNSGNDSLDGGAGNDVMYGDEQDVNTGNGRDTLDGGAGDDQLYGGGGNDIIRGGNDNDTLQGNAGNDNLDGGSGNDSLDGGSGNDTLSGGDGFDDFIEVAGDGADTVTDFGTGDSNINDGNQENNDFVNLESFFNAGTVTAVNNAGGNFGNALGMLRADAADGQIDGSIDGIDYSGQIGDVDITLQNGGAAVTGADLTYDNTNVVCFSAGTLITTIEGLRKVEALQAGDLVLTMDNGYQPLRWLGRRYLDVATLEANERLRPIRIKVGALGANHPDTDLIVSPQHRILLRSKVAFRMFGEHEILVSARRLTVLDGVALDWDHEPVTYFHMMFDNHEIVFANGAPTESLYLGKMAIEALTPDAKREILEIFPSLEDEDFQQSIARYTPEKGKHVRNFLERHVSNSKPLIEALD